MNFKNLKSIADSLLAQRDRYKPGWKRIASKVHPTGYSEIFKSEGTSTDKVPRFSATAAKSCQALAAAHSLSITPSSALWFLISSPLIGNAKHSDVAMKYALKLSVSLWRAFGRGNYTSPFSQSWNDRCAIGHSAIHARVRESDGQFIFTHVPAGSFACAFNEEGIANTMVREFDLSPIEAAQRYGEENLGKFLKADLEDDTKKYTEQHRFWHIVLPNEKGQEGQLYRAPAHRKYLEFTVCPKDEKIIQENGLFELPYFITRFLRYGDNPYGISPAQLAEPIIDRVEGIGELLDLLGRQALEPPMLVPVPMVGMIDYRPSAVTPVPDEYLGSAYPRPLAPQGQYQVGLDRERDGKAEIRDIYYHDAIQPLSGIDREMTAEEVRRRVSENVSTFVHSFSQVISDLTPFLEACLAMLYRWGLRNDCLGDDGILPKIPSELQDQILLQSADGEDVYFNRFNISFTSKMAVAVQEVTNQGDIQGLQQLASIVEATGNTELFDLVNMDKILKDLWLWLSANPDNLRTDKEVAAIRNQRAQAQQEQQQMQQAVVASQVAKDSSQAQRNVST